MFNQSPPHGTPDSQPERSSELISFPMELFFLIGDDLGGLGMVIYDDSLLFLIKSLLLELYGPLNGVHRVNVNEKSQI